MIFSSIFSILDQQLKQSLHFNGGKTIGNFDGRLLVSSQTSIYCIIPIPVETQIQVYYKSALPNSMTKES